MLNHKETSQSTTTLAEWLVPMRCHAERRSKLYDINFAVRKALYRNFVSLIMSSAKVDEISQGI